MASAISSSISVKPFAAVSEHLQRCSPEITGRPPVATMSGAVACPRRRR